MKKEITATSAMLLCALAAPAQSNVKSNGSDDVMQLAAYFLPYLCLLLVVILFVRIYLIQKLQRLQDESYQKLKDRIKDVDWKVTSLGQPNESSFGNFDNNAAIKHLKNQIADIYVQLRALKPSPISQQIEGSVIISSEPQSVTSAPVNQPQPHQEAPPAEEVFYLSTPNSEGSFNVSSAQPNYRPGASIYWFKKTAPNKAIFKIDEREASIKLALQYSDRNIDPVCDSANAYHMSAKKVRTPLGNEGIAELLDDKWIVTKKAKIYYEQ
ncbi:hypothetical protein KXD93_22270 [Mucilaginibacter sp. BJC16-A38]|uniref:hypothetical protein n=1 Tax=Mucilaginibacter phenanthrenivorans TaxID=1234842 RepID=UPI0021585DF9|nr:hypothetical protein [Mucilaginibacter phenanthrenivorans]MCR8560396.1 hypothetical protein [Mucilaginibacter phenanthrenivorans]